MNNTSASLSQGCIRELYSQNRCEAKQPWVQLLDFQESEANQKEITIRISDGLHFTDCTLFGNYRINDSTIIQTKNAATVTTFRRYNLIKLIDYFSKIDETRIAKLKIMVRKMNDCTACNELIGNPQEIHQFMVNSKNLSKENPEQTAKKNRQERQVGTARSESTNIVKLEVPIDLEPTPAIVYPAMNLINPLKTAKKQMSPHNQYQNMPINTSNIPIPHGQINGSNDSLTLSQILRGKEGFLIARLVRFRAAKKQTKDGVMTVCYLGLVDRNNQLIRVHLAGRLAMSNEKTLKKHKSYYIRGFDLVNLKNSGTQIRLKEKQYKIVEIFNEELTKTLPFQYYCWDHESYQNENQCEFVDVIGVIDDIEEKATYTVDTKSVIRVVLKNKFKSIRISFWTDQMKNFENFNLKKRECIIIEDIRKKQGKYYDFSLQSSLINLAQFPFLKERFRDMFPEVVELGPPQNINQLQRLYKQDPNNSTLQNLRAYLTSFKDNKLIYHFCDECKKKVEKNAQQCQQCGSQHLVFKYNCPLEFSDSTGSIVVVLFDAAAQKLIGKTANEINELSEENIQHLFEGLLYRYYLITVEHRNQRILLRNIQAIDQNQEVGLTRQNLEKISKYAEIW